MEKKLTNSGPLMEPADKHSIYAIEYNAPFGVEYFPGIEGALEQIQCRSGDSSITVEGCNLWPHFEDLQAKLCDTLRESEHAQQTAALGVPYIETITVRLWL